MMLLAVGLAMMLNGLPALTSLTRAAVGLGSLQLGMTRDEVLRATPCRLRRPPGRFSGNDLSCSNFKLVTEKMELRLSFKDDRLAVIGLSRTGYSEQRARQEIDVVLSALAGEFGQLRSPQMIAQTVTPDAAFANLKRNLTYSSTATVSVTPVQEVRGLYVNARFSLSRGAAPRSEMSDAGYEGARPPVGGSPFDLVTHTVVVTIRSDSF
jgi:hypothetical protein